MAIPQLRRRGGRGLLDAEPLARAHLRGWASNIILSHCWNHETEGVPAVGDPRCICTSMWHRLTDLSPQRRQSPVTFYSKQWDSWLCLHKDTQLLEKEARPTSRRKAWCCDWDSSVGLSSIQATSRAWRTRSDSLDFAPFWCGLLWRGREWGCRISFGEI